MMHLTHRRILRRHKKWFGQRMHIHYYYYVFEPAAAVRLVFCLYVLTSYNYLPLVHSLASAIVYTRGVFFS